jgi:hypothetical protein
MIHETATTWYLIYRGSFIDSTWRWELLANLGASHCEALGLYKPYCYSYLFFSSDLPGNGCYVQIEDYPFTATARKYTDTGWMQSSYTYGTNPNWDKIAYYAVIETENCSASDKVVLKYRKDTDTVATTLGTITTNGMVKVMFSTPISYKKAMFELHFNTTVNTLSPTVKLLEIHGEEKPETIRVHECTYSLSDTPEEKGSTIRTFLRGGRTSTSLIKFADLRWGEYTTGTAGTNYQYVIMAPGYPQETEIYQEKGKPPELGIKEQWIETNFS